jgi:hypothetical protein
MTALSFDAAAWAEDVYATLLTAHRVLLYDDNVPPRTAWRWWDAAVDHADDRAGSRPPETTAERAEARQAFRAMCEQEFGWADARDLQREQEAEAARQARREAAIDRDVAEEVQAKRSGTWGAW